MQKILKDAHIRRDSDWSSLGFGSSNAGSSSSRAHNALHDLALALEMHWQAPPNPLAAEMTANEVHTFIAFVDAIPGMPTNERAYLDRQFSGVNIARALFRHFKGMMHIDQKNSVALAVSNASTGVATDKHEKEGHGTFMETSRRGVAASVAARVQWLQHRFKEDKTSNKAIKFLCEVLDSIPVTHIGNDVVDSATRVLLEHGAAGGHKVTRLHNTLVGKATQHQLDMMHAAGYAGIASSRR